VLDVVFRKDKSRTRKGQRVKNNEIVKHFTIVLVRAAEKSTESNRVENWPARIKLIPLTWSDPHRDYSICRPGSAPFN